MYLKKIRSLSYKTVKSEDDLLFLFKEKIGNNILEPIGISKNVHHCLFQVQITKSKQF